ncbi:MAG TPA: choice-of-anchor B family protein, partial [Flavobacteriales bacterium]|nr:choice-of-anchor B family protein [Flavobacteriales bacterium]
MKRLFFALSAVVLYNAVSFAQTSLQFLGQKTYSESLSDIWGYADGTKEYALVGVYDGFSIVDVTNPAQPVELHFITGPGTIWRDIKVWGQYAYVVNEESDGLLIVDLSGLPTTETHTWWTGGSLNFTTAHNIYIDENGYAYLMGVPQDNGYYVLDLNTNPTNPTHLGTFDQAYVHDGFVRGDTMWAALISNGTFAVIDVSDKSNPDNILATNASPTNFCHNTWMSDDNNYLFTTDELSGAWIGAFDVSDLTNIQQVDVYRSNPGSGVIPHNAFVLGDFVLISYYTDGVVVLDVTNPGNIVEVANYDTSPFSGDGFDGCWGIYPYLPSGNILATDISEGLFVLGNNYSQACYIEGTVTDSSTNFPLNAADIEILLTPAQTITAITGFYATGVASSGIYTVEVRKPGYQTKTITGLSLSNGVTTTLNVQLVPSIPFQLTGKVLAAQTNQGVPFAHVKIENQDFDFNLLCDGQGNFSIPTFYQGSYDMYGGKWGYVTQKVSTGIDSSSGTVTITVAQGYYDDYIMDFGWVVSGDAPRGIWQRGEPEGTSFQGMNANPDFDLPGDYGDQCFVTGNGGGSAGTDDVDDGVTVLGSPMMDLTTYNDPYINYSRWFANGGGVFGGVPPNDSLLIQIYNGSTYEVLEVVTANSPNMSQWNQRSIRVSDYITPSNQVNILLTASDRDNSGHIVEAGIDLFYVTDNNPNITVNITGNPICAGSSGQIIGSATGGSPPFNFQWTPVFGLSDPNIPNPTVTIDSPILYTLTVTDLFGFTGDSSYLQQVINPNITVSGGTQCANTIILQASSGFIAYQWNTGETTQQITVNQSGNYSVSGLTNDGCITVSNPFVVTIIPPAVATIAVNGNSLTSSPAVIYQWNLDNTA